MATPTKPNNDDRVQRPERIRHPFNKRDYTYAQRFWLPRYIQHSAHIPPGRDGLFELVRPCPRRCATDRVWIERRDGSVLEKCHHPRDAFAGHVWETKWDALHLTYFIGYAIWNYMSIPFLIASAVETATGTIAVREDRRPDAPVL
jgi:hypothetical protein